MDMIPASLMDNESCLVDQEAPEFESVPALLDNDPHGRISLSDYRGKWVLLFSYPLDFTFVCPTEIRELIGAKDRFQAMGVQPILISTDSTFCHHAYQSEVGQCPYPWIGDTNHEVCSRFGILKEDDGIAFRASIIIDPEGIVQSVNVNNLPVGRNIDEVIRSIAAFQEAAKGNLMPCNWQPGQQPLQPA